MSSATARVSYPEPLAVPAVGCTLQASSADWLELKLRLSPTAQPYAHIRVESARVLLPQRETGAGAALFVEATGHGITLRGWVSAAEVPLYAQHPAAIEQVLAIGQAHPLTFRRMQGSLVELQVQALAPFELTARQVTVSHACDQLSPQMPLAQPAALAVLGLSDDALQDKPVIRLPRERALRLSATAAGPTRLTIKLAPALADGSAAHDDLATLIERRGPWLRIAYESGSQLVLGWWLGTATPVSDAFPWGAVGLLPLSAPSLGDGGMGVAPQDTRCAWDAPVVATSGGVSRVVGMMERDAKLIAQTQGDWARIVHLQGLEIDAQAELRIDAERLYRCSPWRRQQHPEFWRR